jgi:hypothetical protein
MSFAKARLKASRSWHAWRRCLARPGASEMLPSERDSERLTAAWIRALTGATLCHGERQGPVATGSSKQPRRWLAQPLLMGLPCRHSAAL